MERILPKDSTLKMSIFKGLTMTDLIVLCVMMLIAVLVFFSNIYMQWVWLALYIVLCITLFIGSGEDRTYLQIAYLMKYYCSRRTFRKGAKKGNTDRLVPFVNIRPDGLVQYDGYYGAIVEIGSMDFGLLDEEEQDRRISALASVFNGLSQSTVIQLIKVDRPIKYDEVASDLFQKIQAARENGDRARETILKSRLEQIDTVNNLMPLYRPYYYIAVYDDNPDVLYGHIDTCRLGLDNAGLSSTFLDARDVAVFLKYLYTRDFDEREIDDIELDELADYVKPETVKFKQAGYIVDGVYAFTLAVKDYPLYVKNAWGANIFDMENTKVVMTIKPVDKDKAIRRIDRVVVESATRTAGKLSEIRNQETHIQTLNVLQSRIQNENEVLFDCTLTVTGFNKSDKSDMAFKKDIRKQLTMDGFRSSSLLSRQIEGFAKSTVARRPKLKGFERGINSDALAAAFPFVFSSIIDVGGYNLGWDYYPVILDIWKRNGEYINSNGIIYGKSGSGKSFFAKLLISMVYSDNSKIFILDPENEYQTLAKNLDGLYIDIGTATYGRINPLHIYPVLTDEGEVASPEVVYDAHLQFLEDFFRITLKGISQDAFEILNNLVKLTYERVGITYQTDCTDKSPEDFPTFDLLKQVVEEEMSRDDITPMYRTNLERVNAYVQKFATGGMYASLWNGPSTLEVNSNFVVFNFQSLFGAKNQTVASAQILVVMRYLDMQIINIREHNRNSDEIIHPFIMLDEGYNFIDPDYPVALQFVYLWYKRIRKYEGSIFFATQNLSDIFGNEKVIAKTSAIVNNSQYSFVFRLDAADLEILTDLYKNAGGINAMERAYISSANRAECFAIFSAHQRARFRVEAHNIVRQIFDEVGKPWES